MKYTIFVTVFAFLVDVTLQCSQMVQYTQCTTKAANDMASCSAIVVDVPTFEFWDCVCKGQNTLMNCYPICSDNKEMMLQYQSQLQNKQSTCTYVDELKRQGLDAPKIDTTETIALPATNGTNTTARIPKPKLNNTKKTATSVTFADDASINYMSLLPLIALVSYLFSA